VQKRVGEARARTGAYVWRDLMKRGVLIANGTDVPVENINPLASYYSSVTRMTNTGAAFYPEQKMTRAEALRTYTLNNAYATFEEQQKGSIAVGKLADLVVLSADIMAIPEADIPKTRVELTIVGGQVRYPREAMVSAK
jgi:predicted amidohydrolase YtcJ